MARVPKYKWYVYKGRCSPLNVSFKIKIKGVDYEMGENDKMVLVVKDGDTEVIREEVTGSGYFEIKPEKTDELKPSNVKYKYDVYFITADGEHEFQVIELSDFILLPTNEHGSEDGGV